MPAMFRSTFVLSVMLSALAACGGTETTVEGPQLPPPPPSGGIKPAKEVEAQPSKYPVTEKKPVVNEYHGVKVTDDYQWLEKGDDPNVKAWVAEQNKRSRAFFDAVPFRAAIRERLKSIMSASNADYGGLIKRKDRFFAMQFEPKKQQPFLITFSSLDDIDKAKTLVDPNAMDPKSSTAIDWYVPSPDGKYIAVSLSEGGTENGTVHVWEADTGKKLSDTVTFAHSGTAGGSLTWTGDSKGFYYTRHPHPGERAKEDMGFFQQVYFHKLGTAEKDDVYSIGKDFVKIAEIELHTSKDGKWVVANVQNGDGGEYWHYVLDTKSGKWTRFADVPDKIVHVDLGEDGKMYLLSLKDAPRGKILRLDPKTADVAKAETLVPQSEAVIQGYAVGKSKLYVKDLLGGPSQVRVFDLKGKEQAKMPIPPVSSVRQLLISNEDDVLFRGGSYTEFGAWYSYSAKSGKVEKTKLAAKPPVSYDDIEVSRENCISKDGTKVPINILRRKGTKWDGQNPTLLTGYGGYGISLTPGAGPFNRVWFDQGGVFALVNLRGGGEFGEEWHLQGNLTKKQNVFDDFYACAKHLVDNKVTNPNKLAIEGGSNGGLLMGAVLTQHPEMFKAVVAAVGIFDMLRSENSTNGMFNTTEFGTVKNPDHFKALYAYSPLHNVKDGTAYPAVLFTTGANDPRVEAYQSRKMTARMQAATSGGIVLLRENDKTGHGMGTPLDERIDEEADSFAFLMKELGMEYK